MSPVQKPSPSNQFFALGRVGVSPRRAAIVLLIGTAILYGVRLGHLDFWAPDEPRYGAIAEELRSFRHGAGGLVLLHLNDTPYTQKPPLYFWLAALAGAPGGFVSEWAARIPSALAGLACVALTALVGRRLLGHPFVALLAAGLLATSFRFVFTARRAQLDVLLTSFELIAIAAFVFFEFRPNTTMNTFSDASDCADASTTPTAAVAGGKPTVLTIAGIHAALGAAALVKGPVGWLPLAIIAVYFAWEGRFRCFRDYVPIWSPALSFAPLILWISAAIALAPAGFAETAVAENLIGRFFSGTSHARPFYYFLYQLPADFMPWTLLLPFGGLRVWKWLRAPAGTEDSLRPKANSALRFLLSWIAVPLLFFSLSAGKRGVYLLPIFPALGLLAAIGAARLTSRGDTDSGSLGWTGRAVGAIAVIELVLLALAAPMLEAEKSPRPIAEAISRESRSDESIGVYGLEPIEGAIAYYGGRRVASLDDEQALRSFLAVIEERRFVLLRTRHFELLGAELGLEQVARFRSPPRELVLAVRKPQAPPGAEIVDPLQSRIQAR